MSSFSNYVGSFLNPFLYVSPDFDNTLKFVKKIHDRKGYQTDQMYLTFESKIRECQTGKCPYTFNQLQDLACEISPGLGMAGSVHHMCRFVAKE